MSDAPMLTAATLAALPRKVPMPFRVELTGGILECDTLLRILPGKRIVCRASWHGKTVLAKIYLSSRANQHLNREARGLQRLLEAGLAAPTILATQQLTEGLAEVLLLEYFTNATDFSVRWNNTANQIEQNALLCQAVTLIADMHSKGLRQGDIHLDNFLFHHTERGEQIILIDGADIQPTKPSDQQTRLENLALFFAQFPHKNDSLIKDAYQLYCQTQNLPFDAVQAGMVLWQTATKRAERSEKFIKKSFRESTQFMQIKSWHRRLICQRNYYNPEFQTLLENLDQAIAEGEILKRGNSATVARVKVGTLDLVIKRYNIKNTLHRVRRAFQPSRAAVSWANAQRLTHCGIETPEAIAILEERTGPLRGRAYIINRYMPGVSAEQFFADNAPNSKNSKLLIPQFDEIFRAMANIRVSHGDLKASNFIISDQRVVLIDLDSMRQHHQQRKFQAAFNKDMARFQRNWNQWPKLAAAFKEVGVDP